MKADTGAIYADRKNGYSYGWSRSNTGNAVDRNNRKSPDQAYDTANFFRDAGKANSSRTWEIELPKGSYVVRIVAGDPNADMKPTIRAEGIDVIQGSTTAANRWLDATRTIEVTDGRLTLSSGEGTSRNSINFITINPISDPVPEPTPEPEPTPTPVPEPEPEPTPTPPPTPQLKWPTQWQAATAAPVARFEALSVSSNGKLYVFGGWIDKNFNSTRRVDRYDPVTNKWTRLADMQAPETHAGFALDAANGVVYFVGGHRGKFPSVASDDVWKYTIATDTWTKVGARLPYAMGGGGAAIVNGKLHSFGGDFADRYTNTAGHFVLDLANVEAGFRTAAPMPEARDHFSTQVINGQIYTFGGEFGHDRLRDQQRMTHRYDPVTDTWTRLADAPGNRSHAESSIFQMNGRVYWAGGQSGFDQKPMSSVVMYDPATDRWSTLAPLPAARQGTTVLRVGDYLVFTLGGTGTTQPQRTTWRAKLTPL